MTLSLEKKIFAGLAGAVLALLAIGATTWWNASRLVQTFRWVDHTQEVIRHLGDLLNEVLTMQIGARDYVLTGDDTVLESYRRGAANSRHLVGELRRLTVDQDAQQQHLARIAPLLEEAALKMQERIDVRRSSGLAAVAALPPASAAAVAQIRREVGAMHLFEEHLLATRSAAVVRNLELTMAWAVLGGLLAILLLASAAGIIRRDFRRRRDAERALERNRATFESLFENAADGLVVVGHDGHIVRLNRTAETLFGFAREELIGMPIERLIPDEFLHAHQQHRARYMDAQRVRQLGGHLGLQARRKDGTVFPVEIMLSPLETEEGRVIMATVRDITRRKAAEQRIAQLNDDLQRQNDQLAVAVKELEAFSYSVSHDLRAPLRHIDGFANLLAQHAQEGLDETSRRYLDTISRAALRMGRLIDDLLAFSRTGRTPVNVAPVAHHDVVAGVIRDLQASAFPAAPAWHIGPLPTLPGDEAMLRQVWFNLLENAAKYSSKSPGPCVEIRAEKSADGAEWIFSVRDNGVGFDMQHQSKLFGVFQRLHAASEFPGTGIGLANVRRIVSRHGGRTWAEAIKGQGATFYFSLPVDSAKVTASARVGPAVAVLS